MRRVNVMFDIDGVLADFVLGATKTLAQLGFLEKPYTTHEQKQWDFQIPKQQEKKLWETIKRDEDFWLHLDPLISMDEMNQLWQLKMAANLYFVTSRTNGGGTAKTQTERWLGRTLGVYGATVIVSAKKGQIAEAIEADFAIDDKAGNAVYVAYNSPRTKSFLVDRPYNKFDQTVLGTKVTRVASVGDFIRAVNDEIACRG